MKDNNRKIIYMKTISFQKTILKSIYILFIVLVFTNCKKDFQPLEKSTDQLVMSEYVAINSNFSEFNALLISTGLNDLLSIRGPYSLFLPTNDAMKAYYAEKSINSFSDLDSLTRRELVLNHLVAQDFTVSEYQLGTLSKKNAIGDNIVTEIQGADIIINKFSKITKRDIRVSNGIIQIIDKVLDPLKLSVYDKLAADPSYSIFTEGLKRTGLKDTLQVITFLYGQNLARTRYTILAIADTTFNRFGIYSIDDLINKYTSSPDSITFPNNGFYAYMDFHCLDREAFYLSDFPEAATLYSVLSKNNNIQIKIVAEVVQINFNSIDSSYTSLYVDQSDIPAKNGVIHTINRLLEVSAPAPTTFIWEVTDYFDLKQGEYYLKHFQKFFDTAQFAGIRWHGEYLQYYIKAAADAQPELNDDCLNMIGFWEIVVTTPKIMKGKYLLAGRVWQGNMDFAVYIDGVQTQINLKNDAPTVPSGTTLDGSSLYRFAEVDWKTTAEHKIKLIALSSGTLFWDRVEFHPVH
jgi:uncharacterized surface protein with fasciclin (FAS1) repeats